MDDCADLEVTLRRLDGETYSVALRSAVPGSETMSDIAAGEGCTAVISPSELAEFLPDAAHYGRALSGALLAHPKVRSAFAAAIQEARTMGIPLRVRLVMEAPELHGVRWELLVDPDDHASVLSMSDRIRLSRYPTSADRERVRLRRRSELRALIVAANPRRRGLPEVDVRGEQHRVRQALGRIHAEVLPDDEGQATLTNVLSRLRAHPYDILYVVAHGALRDGNPELWLDQEQGLSHPVDGVLFADHIRQLDVRPRLIVLASCESAGSGSVAHGALGPRLAEAGIPAVIAMQDVVGMGTISRFMQTFFSQLTVDGVIDRAVAEARRSVWNEPDCWVPALFMRLSSGRIWSTGFGTGRTVREDWTNLTSNVEERQCTPLLGPNLLEPLVGPRHDIARAIADRYHYPLSTGDRDRLHTVEQYVKTTFTLDQAHKALRAEYREVLLARHAHAVSDELRTSKVWNVDSFASAMGAALDVYLEGHPESPYRRLAKLRLPIYIDTSTHDAMEKALLLEQVEPVVRVCPWYVKVPDRLLHVCDQAPTPERPLVYHLFGRSKIPESVVCGEDGFFDFLLGVSKNYEHVPNDVRAALVSTSLLILGFRLDDPEFRVAFRFILTREGRELLRARRHAAVQIEPTDDLVSDVGLAQDYFERYFTSEGLNPYWGTVDEFLDELAKLLAEASWSH